MSIKLFLSVSLLLSASTTKGAAQPGWPSEVLHMIDDDADCTENLCSEATQLLQVHVTGPDTDNTVAPNYHLLMDQTSVDPLPANATAAQPHAAIFHSFLEKHGRQYGPGTPDYTWRRRLFMRRASEAARHNLKANRLWTAGVNTLTDRSDEELRALLGWSGLAAPGAVTGGAAAPAFLQIGSVSSIHHWGEGKSTALPGEWNWGHLNATQRVHNQGKCGSCWAVSSVSVLQAHVEIHAPERARPLSVQELISCVDNPHHCGGDGACDGATAELAMDYAMRYGLAAESEDAPEAVAPEVAATSEGQKGGCPRRDKSGAAGAQILLEGSASSQNQLDISAPGVRNGGSSTVSESRGLGIKAWERLPPNSYSPLMHALVERGPAAVAVFASKWFSYSHGIFDGCERDAVIDHAVVLLGYGSDRELGAKYWLIQNSWGPEWGESGRIRLLRQHNDETEYCGIDSQPQEGTGCEGGPAQVKVCGMCGVLYDTVVPHF